MSRLHGIWRHVVCLTVVVMGLSPVTAQTGFYIRELNTQTWNMDNHYEVYQALVNPADALALDLLGHVTTDDDDFGFPNVVNTGQAGSGVFGALDEFLPFEGGDHYAMEARAEVTIPAGTWSIGFGTDDGGQLTLQTKSGSPIAFSSSFAQNGVGNYRLRGQPANQIWFLGNRGHAWTGGTFTVTEPTTATFHSSFHEAGGGDNFEVAIFQGTSTGVANNTWVLLEDGALGWGVKPTEDLPAMQPIGLPQGPGLLM